MQAETIRRVHIKEIQMFNYSLEVKWKWRFAAVMAYEKKY